MGYAQKTNFAFIHQPGHFSPGFFDIWLGVWPVDLPQVDHIRLQAAKAVFAFLADPPAFQVAEYFAGLFIPAAAAFRGYDHFVAAVFYRPGDDFFSMPQAVTGGSIDPINTLVKGLVNR